MPFQQHTSDELVKLFNQKPFQGQSPEKAKVIFLSSDANYSLEITEHDFFEKIIEYQEDGVKFWETHNVHHPFLLPNYPLLRNQGGVPFHRNFSNIGLTSEYASLITFLELLSVPTIGNATDNPQEFYNLAFKDKNHLKYIDKLITGGGGKLFFISSGVLIKMLKLKKENNQEIFKWLDIDTFTHQKNSIMVGNNKVEKIYHFSTWQIHGQIDSIRSTIIDWSRDN